MTARLPVPGSDEGTWGDILNSFLDVSHNVDGTLKSSALNTAGVYTKPGSGIPKTDLDSSVQTSLGKADTALQSAPVTSVAGKTGVVTLAESDITNLTTDLAAKANTSSLATVATSGSYADLSNLPHVLLPASNGSDDTAAVNAAISASPTNSVIVGRPGTTYIAGSGPFQFVGTRTYWMYGVTMRPKNAGNFDAVVASPAALTSGAGNSLDGPIRIYGLQVNGNVANQTSGQGNGILLASGANVLYGPTILQDVHVRDTRGSGICVSEVNLDGTALSNGSAAPYSGEMHIENCRTYNSGANGIWQRGGATGGINMTDGFCINNTVAYTTHDGIRIDSAGGWRIDGNHPYGTGLSGIIITGSYATKITNSYIEGIGVLDSAVDHFSASSAFSQAPTWSSGSTYSYNQVVIYSGVVYKSKVDSNIGNQPDISATQWAAYNGGGSVGAIMAMSSQSARPLHIVNNQISLGHNSWGLNANFLYRGILVQGPATGTSKVSAFILGNDITNELQPAGTNTTAIRLAAAGAGPSGVHSFEQSNVTRGAWNSTRSADATAAPVGSVGAGAAGGTGASITVTGNNQVGNISVTSGNSGIVAGALASVSYTNTMGVTPRVVVEPRSAAAAALGPIYVTTSTTGFTINTSVAPANNTAYSFDYIATMGV